jgi:hypothetical protein
MEISIHKPKAMTIRKEPPRSKSESNGRMVEKKLWDLTTWAYTLPVQEIKIKAQKAVRMAV